MLKMKTLPAGFPVALCDSTIQSCYRHRNRSFLFLRTADFVVHAVDVVDVPVSEIVAFPVRGVSWSEVATVPKRKLHRGLDLDLSLNSEVNIRKGWKENGGTK